MDRPQAGDADTAAALARLAPAGVLIGHRRIAEGDEHALLEAEAALVATSALKVRRQSGAARIVARGLLRALGEPNAALPRSASGAPVWPTGIVGSIAHDDEVAVATVVRSGHVRSVGIDVEPADALPRELVPIVATATERARYNAAVLESRILFCAKEAVFKALYPLCGLFLDFHDIEIDLDAGSARVRDAHSASVSFTEAPRVIALAVVQGPSLMLSDGDTHKGRPLWSPRLARHVSQQRGDHEGRPYSTMRACTAEPLFFGAVNQI